MALARNDSPATASFKQKILPSRAKRRLQARVVLLFGDLVALTVSIIVAAAVHPNGLVGNRTNDLLVALLPLYVFGAFQTRAFGHQVLDRWRSGARRALVGLCMAAFLLFAIGFASKTTAQFSRLVLATGLAGSACLILTLRYLNRIVIARLLPDGPIDTVLLVDSAPLPQSVRYPVLDAAALGLRPELDSPQMLDLIGRILRGRDRVIVACSSVARERWATALKGLGIEVQVLIPELDTLGMIGVTRHGDNLTAVVAQGPLSMSNLIVKRTFDLAVVLFCLPVLILVWTAVAVAIKLDDGGPILFRQQRIGHGNRMFDMLKFRSMRTTHADHHGQTSTARGDPRITRVGRLLRSSSLDELPQLLNVLIGDMSIVGPRPHALRSTAEDQLFWEADARYWLRHAVKPGLTGLAQVRGFRGATARVSDLQNRVQSDLEYLVGWTLWRDVRIVAHTVRVMLHHNAY